MERVRKSRNHLREEEAEVVGVGVQWPLFVTASWLLLRRTWLQVRGNDVVHELFLLQDGALIPAFRCT
jgi:hypothetical protein